MGYRSNGRRNIRIIDSLFFCNFIPVAELFKNSNLSSGRLVPSISWEGQKALNALCYLAIHVEL